jgi:hypothetical protein
MGKRRTSYSGNATTPIVMMVMFVGGSFLQAGFFFDWRADADSTGHEQTS